MHCCISTPLIHGRHIYGIDAYGQLRCLDVRTGDRVWESSDAVVPNRWATAHMVRNGGRIWMFNEHGELIISELSPDGYKEMARFTITRPETHMPYVYGGNMWTVPAIANGRLYIRDLDTLYAYDIKR